ncbi:uncharacterized protein LOC128551170 [Mercenaria mercenaria]|uniref:uncharacterized protein LOC128551170 n=1 Tax=Mercenaria mercenaria TaxID=6596 RepID=UPI00234FA541|nr:uncharacterized protein LOC128551170 [Mercenaria mercenaria]
MITDGIIDNDNTFHGRSFMKWVLRQKGNSGAFWCGTIENEKDAEKLGKELIKYFEQFSSDDTANNAQPGERFQDSKHKLNGYKYNGKKALYNTNSPESFESGDILDDIPLGQKVMKFGATTNLTIGTIQAKSVQDIALCVKNNQTLTFNGLIAVRPDPDLLTFSRKGDSGSLVVTRDGQKAVGILIAGGGSKYKKCHMSYICPIRNVLNKLKGDYSLAKVKEHVLIEKSPYVESPSGAEGPA